MLRLALALLLAPAAAYVRSATAVGGDVVKGAGSLTKGGKVGLYTALLQAINPGLGDLKQMLECCGAASGLAAQAATLLNTNQFQGDIEAKVREDFVGKGKCHDPGLTSLLQEGNPSCSYLYSFASKDFKTYSYAAWCVPMDVCSVDVAGATKGLKVGYSLVLQILNRNYGDLQYAGEGDLTSCYESMNMVNLANMSFQKEVDQFMEMIPGVKIPLGKKLEFSFKGMQNVGLVKMLNKCEQRADRGMLYVYKNKFWNEQQQALNITHFDLEELKKKEAARLAKEQAAKEQQYTLGTQQALVGSAEALAEPTDLEKMSELGAVAEVAREETHEVSKDQRLSVAREAIHTAQKNINKDTETDVVSVFRPVLRPQTSFLSSLSRVRKR